MTDDMRGREILGFHVEEFIGQGGMASVWRAENPNIERQVAIKVLDPLLARDAKLVERFRIEARVQSKLRHANIVSVENFCTDPLAMVMEYVDGRTMAEVIGREVGPIPLQRALPYMSQILAAVDHAHKQDVIHRDLKPSNILVTHEDQVKVMDFGIAKVMRGVRITRTGTTLGTAVYMSPEQIQGAKGVDRRSDIYSLGVTFYEMLAGRAPFEETEGDGDFAIKEAHVRKTPPDPRQFYGHIPQDAVDVLMRALAKDPADRFQYAEQMADALEAATLGDARALVTTGPQRPLTDEYDDLFTIPPEDLTVDSEAPTEIHNVAEILPWPYPEPEPSTLISPPPESSNILRPVPAPEPPTAPLPLPTSRDSSLRSTMILLGLTGGLIVLLAVVAGLLWGRGNDAPPAPTPAPSPKPALSPKPAPEPVPAPKTRWVRVTSTPPGASIAICGKRTDDTTPATIEIPAGQRCAMVLSLDGYEDYRVQASAVGAAISIPANLQKSPPQPRRFAWRNEVDRALVHYRKRKWTQASSILKETASRLQGEDKRKVEDLAANVRKVASNWIRGDRSTNASKRHEYYSMAKKHDRKMPGRPHQRALQRLIQRSEPRSGRDSLDDLIDGALPRKKRKPRPGDNLPETLNKSQIQGGMRSTKTKVQACFDRFKVPGLARVSITIGRKGRVTSAKVKGVFAGTPTGDCVKKATRGARFPKFKGSPITITYPFLLR